MAGRKRIKWGEHPSIALVSGKPRLKVFEEYFVEEELPKFKRLNDAGDKDPDVKAPALTLTSNDVTDMGPALPGDGVVAHGTDKAAAANARWTRARYVALQSGSQDIASQQKDPKRGPFARAVGAAVQWVKGLAAGAEAPEPMSVEEAFMLAKEERITVTTEELLRSRAIAAALVRRFEQTCQYAMAKKVRDHLDLLAAKLALAERGMCRYITEEQAIDFMTKAERGVQVEFLRYYPEVLPNDVAAKVAECNLAFLFDNYVVMYYSKSVSPVRLLEEEIDEQERHRRRDPILFGTLRGSRDLYYVADWVYGDDDLTLETVEKAIGTIPTLKDEKVEDSQLRLEALLHDLGDEADRTVAAARDAGHLLALQAPETPETPEAPETPAAEQKEAQP